VSVPFAAGGGGHALVLGATGSGKTVTQAWIAGRAIERGLGAVIVDPKGDSTLREELLRSAAAGSRPFLAWSPRGALAYNPYARGSDTEIADKLLAGERFTEPHYQRQAQRYLGHAVRALQAAGAEVSLRAVVERLEPERLEALARALPEPDAAPLHGYLDSLGPRQRAELAGVRDRLAILAESEVGRWLDPGGERSPERHSAPGRSAGASLDLLAAVRERAVVYFSLEADRLPLLTEMLAGAIVQDLCSIVAALQERPVPTLVVIDEFSAVAPARVVRLFARARSAGFSLLLGTQELSDLRPPGGERLLEQVMGNISLLIAHRQVVPGSAELIARLGGGGSPRGSSCAAEAGAAEAGAGPPLRERSIMELAPGWGAVIVLGAGRRAQIARMFAPGPAPAAGGDGARAR
jgi:hypothetical protein